MIQKKAGRISVMDLDDMASESHMIITGRNENKHAVHATEDPYIKSIPEPKGWILYNKPELGDISSSFEKAVNDVYMAVFNFSRSIKTATADEQIDKQELAGLKRLRVDIVKQADEVILLVENLH
jgi:hypothetical protein